MATLRSFCPSSIVLFALAVPYALGQQTEPVPADANAMQIAAQYRQPDRAWAEEFMREYRNIPSGITLEGDGRGLQEIRSSTYDAAENRFLLNGSIVYRCPLCEEMLYTIEHMQDKHPSIKAVVFAHVPLYNAEVRVAGGGVRCDEAMLAGFAEALLHEVLKEIR